MKPLILDDRVLRSIGDTLLVPTLQFRHATGYDLYVRTLHEWADVLDGNMKVDRLEWLLFRHNGAQLPA